jgi:hypothetical protein
MKIPVFWNIILRYGINSISKKNVCSSSAKFDNPVTQRHIPRERNPYPHHYEYLKIHFRLFRCASRSIKHKTRHFVLEIHSHNIQKFISYDTDTNRDSTNMTCYTMLKEIIRKYLEQCTNVIVLMHFFLLHK